MITGKDMRRIISDLYLKDRTIVSEDSDYCLEYFKKYLDLDIKEYPSGDVYWNWVIPDKYSVREAHIKDAETGKIVLDAKDNPLYLANYSMPFEGVLGFEELKGHLFWNESVPEGVPNYYRLQYRPWEKDWKFCISYENLGNFKKDRKYIVKIDTVLEKGTLKVGEYFKKGKSEDTVVLVSHYDHPGQVNDGLSGAVVQLALMEQIARRDTHYSYLFLTVPEILGSVAYLSKSGNIKKLKMGIFAEMLSTGLKLQLQRSFFGNAYIDRAAELVFREEFGDFDVFGYLEGAGNDEVVFESPGIEVPFVSIMRARSNGKLYRQYHTHLDNLDMVNEAQLEEAVRILIKLTDVLENDFYVTRKFKGYLCLSNPGIGLYSNEALKSQLRSFLNGGFRYFDGRHRISDIAVKYNIKFELVLDFVKKMEEKGLVTLSHRERH